METYRRTVLKIIGLLRFPFGGALLVAFFVKLFGVQDTFADGYFDNGVLDTTFKAFLMIEVSYWALRYRVLADSLKK